MKTFKIDTTICELIENLDEKSNIQDFLIRLMYFGIYGYAYDIEPYTHKILYSIAYNGLFKQLEKDRQKWTKATIQGICKNAGVDIAEVVTEITAYRVIYAPDVKEDIQEEIEQRILEKNSFIFYISMYENLTLLANIFKENESESWQFFKGLCDYMFNDVEPTTEIATLFILSNKEILDRQKWHSKGGGASKRPKATEQTYTPQTIETTPTPTPTNTAQPAQPQRARSNTDHNDSTCARFKHGLINIISKNNTAIT